MTKIETNQAYSVNIELKLCFLKENFAGRRKNTQYVSGYLSKVENLEDDRQIEPESPPVLFFSLDAFEASIFAHRKLISPYMVGQLSQEILLASQALRD